MTNLCYMGMNLFIIHLTFCLYLKAFFLHKFSQLARCPLWRRHRGLGQIECWSGVYRYKSTTTKILSNEMFVSEVEPSSSESESG